MGVKMYETHDGSVGFLTKKTSAMKRLSCLFGIHSLYDDLVDCIVVQLKRLGADDLPVLDDLPVPDDPDDLPVPDDLQAPYDLPVLDHPLEAPSLDELLGAPLDGPLEEANPPHERSDERSDERCGLSSREKRLPDERESLNDSPADERPGLLSKRDDEDEQVRSELALGVFTN